MAAAVVAAVEVEVGTGFASLDNLDLAPVAFAGIHPSCSQSLEC